MNLKFEIRAAYILFNGVSQDKELSDLLHCK